MPADALLPLYQHKQVAFHCPRVQQQLGNLTVQSEIVLKRPKTRDVAWTHVACIA
jgi:hypothetical protein